MGNREHDNNQTVVVLDCNDKFVEHNLMMAVDLRHGHDIWQTDFVASTRFLLGGGEPGGEPRGVAFVNVA